jgi:hypothetical protein
MWDKIINGSAVWANDAGIVNSSTTSQSRSRHRVATVVSSVGTGVGTGVIASTVDVNVGVLVGAASLTSFAGLGVVVVGQHEFLSKLLNEHI